MARVAVDSSVLIAALLAWHEHHESSRAELERLAGETPEPLLPSHAVIETYSVLTRLPMPHRLAPEIASRLLAESFGDWPTAGGPADIWAFVAESAESRVVGGRVYDALILATAATAGASELLTWNLAHFEDLATDRIAVRSPPSGAPGVANPRA